MGSPEKKFSINFTGAYTKFCLSLHYNGDNTYLFVNGKEIFKFKTDHKNVNFPTQFYLGSVSNGLGALESREVSLNGNEYDFLVDYNSIDKSDILNIDNSDILNIHKYLMVKNNIKFVELFKKIVMLLTSIVNVSKDTNCVSLSYQKCEIQPAFMNLHPNQQSWEFHYCSFTFKLDKFIGSCNTLNYL